MKTAGEWEEEYIRDDEGWAYKDARVKFIRAIQADAASAPSVPNGWKLVPMEPTEKMLDVAVSFALNVNISSDYNWSRYMTDVYARMLAAAPQADKEG